MTSTPLDLVAELEKEPHGNDCTIKCPCGSCLCDCWKSRLPALRAALDARETLPVEAVQGAIYQAVGCAFSAGIQFGVQRTTDDAWAKSQKDHAVGIGMKAYRGALNTPVGGEGKEG